MTNAAWTETSAPSMIVVASRQLAQRPAQLVTAGAEASAPLETRLKRRVHVELDSSSVAEANKRVIRRYVELRNQNRIDLVLELISPDYVVNRPGLPAGIDGFLAMDAETRAAFPDFQVTIKDLIAEGDQVVNHFAIAGTHLGPWRGVAPTGKRVIINAITVFTVRDGKITARYGYASDLEVLKQMGKNIAGSRLSP